MKKIAALKYLKYLFWLGPMLVVAGISAGFVSGSWSPVPLGLIIAGVVGLGLGLVVVGQGEASSSPEPVFWGRRSTQAGANALLATVALVVILGLVNFLAVRHVGRLDLTENQVFTLAPETQQIVRNLKQPVKVWMFTPQANPQDRELLESYRRLGDRFSYEVVNPNAQPNLVQRLEVKSPGDVIVELPSSAGRKQFVQSVTAGNSESLLNEGEQLSEAKLTNAIEQLTSDRRTTVYFLQGHGERSLESGQGAISQAVKLLGEKNFTSKPLNLATTPEFPADAKVVVVAGPQKALLDPEVKALQTYLQQGGNLLVMIDPGNPNPNLTSLLANWGVDLDKRVVIDPSGSLINLGPADAVVAQYGDHPITKELQGKLSFYSLSRPLGIKSVPDVKATPLLYTSDKSWAESDLKSQDLQLNPPADQPGPLVLGVAFSRPVKPPAASPSLQASTSPTPKASATSPSPAAKPSPPSASPSPSPTGETGTQGKAQESRLVVIGNSTFATDGLFDSNQVVNGDVFVNSVRWLSQDDQATFAIRPKEVKNRRLNLTTQQASLSSLLALAILPLAGFVTAIAVWWRRR